MWAVYISKKKKKKKGKVRISKNVLLLNNKKMAETVKIKFFRALDIEQSFAAAWGTFIPEKQLNFGKSEELCDIFNLP